MIYLIKEIIINRLKRIEKTGIEKLKGGNDCFNAK